MILKVKPAKPIKVTAKTITIFVPKVAVPIRRQSCVVKMGGVSVSINGAIVFGEPNAHINTLKVTTVIRKDRLVLLEVKVKEKAVTVGNPIVQVASQNPYASST